MEYQDYHDAFKKSALSFNIKDVHNKKSQYVGVSWKKSYRKWQANIKIDGKRKSLGSYHDENEAARMYDKQAALLNKPMNFPQHEGQEQAVKPRKDVSKVPNVNRSSNYVGVIWNKMKRKWEVRITFNGKRHHLGYYLDENEAARMYDKQAALLNRPVNFPEHEGQEQVTKYAARRDLSKVPNVTNVNRPSKYVGVIWNKQMRRWQARIRIDGKLNYLSFHHDEKEAACIYDEKAVLLNRPVNFPQHEGQKQAVKSQIGVMRGSKFVGVSYHKQRKKWKSYITLNGKFKHLGLFDDEKKAAYQYDDQAKLIDRPVNFPKEGQNKAKKNKCFDSIDNVQSKRTKIRYYPDD